MFLENGITSGQSISSQSDRKLLIIQPGHVQINRTGFLGDTGSALSGEAIHTLTW